MTLSSSEPRISIIVAIVSGGESLANCLRALHKQAGDVGAEIIVPFDQWTSNVTHLSKDFPDVRFVELPSVSSPRFKDAFRHSHYDRRRAVGLASARGAVIAMTEDHAIPSPDWCERVLHAHVEMERVGVIGGAIENGVDAALNWAWYYCDFGRYGRPFETRNVDYVSDVNVSYKRHAIMSVKEVWNSDFHETSVHWALSRNGERLCLDPSMVVFQHRPKLRLWAALRERVEWGRTFADTRAKEVGKLKRYSYAVGCAFLPTLLFVRALKAMIRQRRSMSDIARVSPLIVLLVVFWSIGEAIGYLLPSRSGDPAVMRTLESAI